MRLHEYNPYGRFLHRVFYAAVDQRLLYIGNLPEDQFELIGHSGHLTLFQNYKLQTSAFSDLGVCRWVPFTHRPVRTVLVRCRWLFQCSKLPSAYYGTRNTQYSQAGDVGCPPDNEHQE